MRDHYRRQGRAVLAAPFPYPDGRRVARPPSSPRSTSPAPQSRPSRASSGALSRCTRTRWTRRLRSRRRRQPASRCAPSRSSRYETNVRQRRRSTRRLVVHRGADRRDGATRPRLLFAEVAKMGEGSMLEGCMRRDRGELVPGSHLPIRPTSSSARSISGERIVVGVNDFTRATTTRTWQRCVITHEDEQKQLKRLAKVRRRAQ